MIIFLFMMNMNLNPMNFLINFSFFLMCLMMMLMNIFNDKWMLLILMILIVGGMMIFISMMASTMKFNLIMKNKFYYLILMLIFYEIYMDNMNFSFKIILSTMNNISLFLYCFLIMMNVIFLKKIMFKKQKSLKI
uniref:NADH dehydrogenase subunit 6 n=1 Tax=Amphitetranychus viennensis TaxID=381746 RepID=A0A1L4AHK7_9ACAR|nr:NADH dehydrogenase subunit 6 [Amphitetranychus viennensis]API67783.1 NADH dehydrogenase subunit 6 [Amphitetranychus viennensis]